MHKLINLISLSILVTSAFAAATIRNFKNSNLIINGSQLILNTNDSFVSFFALGDWGGTGLPIITKTPAQLSSAYQMGKMSSSYQTKFQLGLGDNFYLYGVQDVKDKKFKEIFEEVYSSDQLKNTPWFHILGNHDHYGNPQAQIDYTSKSNRWVMPNYNYTVDVMTTNSKKKLISIVMIDTIKLCGNTAFTINPFSTVDGSLPSFKTTADRDLALEYFKELETRLKKISESNVPYFIVGGHFPIYSVAEHGPTQCLIDKLMPMLHKYKVSAYLSGHDHNLQHISYTYLNSTVEYMVTGANSFNQNSVVHANQVPVGSLKFRWPTSTELIYGGFLMIQANDKNLTVNFVKADGSILYNKVILPRA